MSRTGLFRRAVEVPITAAITGTATATIDEADIVAGGKTIIITLTGDTWLAAGTGPIGTTAQTNAILAGIDSAQSETLGWDNEVKANFVSTDLVRTSATVATITMGAESAYDITAPETITVTIPSAALTASAVDVMATPSISIVANVCSSGLLVGIPFQYYDPGFGNGVAFSDRPSGVIATGGVFCIDGGGFFDTSGCTVIDSGTGARRLITITENPTDASSSFNALTTGEWQISYRPDNTGIDVQPGGNYLGANFLSDFGLNLSQRMYYS